MPHLVDKNDSKKLMKKSFYFQVATGAVRVIWGDQNSAVLTNKVGCLWQENACN